MGRMNPYILGGMEAVNPYLIVGTDCRLYHAYWFDGIATDHSIYGNDGTVVGPIYVPGLGNQFDGSDDYVKRDNCNLGLNGSTEFSIVAWMKFLHWGKYEWLFLKPHAAGWNTFNVKLLDLNQIWLSLENDTLSAYPQWNTTAAVPLNQWFQFGFAWKRNLITGADGVMYVNGSPIASTFTAYSYSSSFVMKETSNTLTIGRLPATAWVLDGLMGENRIFTAQKLDADMLADYNATKARYGL